MARTIHEFVTVDSDGRIQLRSGPLPAGAQAEVTVRLVDEAEEAALEAARVKARAELLASSPPKPPSRSMSEIFEAARRSGQRSFKTDEEVRAYIRELRDE